MRIARNSLLSLLVVFLALAVGSWAHAQNVDKDNNKDKSKSAAPLTVPVTGAGTGSFNGTFTIERFAATSTGVVAVGLLKVHNTPVNMMRVQASCDILNLVLGPLHLDLLGLVIDLNQVVLNITGETGAGNLLGNLLCGITGILDGPLPGLGQLIVLAGLLNQLLGILGGL